VIDGVLVDVEGVLQVDGRPISGAAEALHALAEAGIPVVLLTNTTNRTRRQLGALLRRLEFPVSDERIVTAVSATADYVRQRYPGERCFLLVEGDVIEEFAGIQLTEGIDARVVVVGGAGDSFTYGRVNQAFRLLLDGAAFVAMHRNLAWERQDGLYLDSGAYIAGLEAATGVRAHVVGKPAVEFFRAGLRLLGLPGERVAMVGDTLEQDVLPAQQLGLAGILVRTGRYRARESETGQPDLILDSLAELPEWLGLRPVR
jgi:HAD superfamily hydrolase (TIGR01458 family)